MTDSRAKGARFEQNLAAYLRQWWPAARRAVAAGWRNGTTDMADPGDIAGVPGLIISAKDVNADTERQAGTWRRWWGELDAMLAADPAALGVIVVKRPGHPDPADAWAHLQLADFSDLLGGGTARRDPIRVRLGDLVELLVAAGYARKVPA